MYSLYKTPIRRPIYTKIVAKQCSYGLQALNQCFSEASDIPLHKKHSGKGGPPLDFFACEGVGFRLTWMRPLNHALLPNCAILLRVFVSYVERVEQTKINHRKSTGNTLSYKPSIFLLLLLLRISFLTSLKFNYHCIIITYKVFSSVCCSLTGR